MPTFGLFRKQKKEEPPEKEAITVSSPETTAEVKTYLKAMPLRELSDLEIVKNEVKSGNIVILRISPLANKRIEEVKQAVDQLYEFAGSVNGDIARLGEERVVICPNTIRIWREKSPIQNEPLPTAA